MKIIVWFGAYLLGGALCGVAMTLCGNPPPKDMKYPYVLVMFLWVPALIGLALTYGVEVMESALRWLAGGQKP